MTPTVHSKYPSLVVAQHSTATSTPITMTATAASASVRVATKEDFDRVTEVVTEAFVHDPVFSYFASLKEVNISGAPCSSVLVPTLFS